MDCWSLARMKRNWMGAAALFALLFLLAPPALASQGSSRVSAELDYRLLSAWIGAERGGTGALWTVQELESGSKVVLVRPAFKRHGERLVLQGRLQVLRDGRAEYSREVSLLQQPELSPGKGLLRLKTVERRFSDSLDQGEKAPPEDYPFHLQSLEGLGAFELSLAQLQERIGSALTASSPEAEASQMAPASRGFSLSAVEAGEAGLQISGRCSLDLQEPHSGEGVKAGRQARSQDLMAWDAFVTRLLCSLHGASLSRQERDVLLSLLLRERHACLPCLSGRSPERAISLPQRYVRVWSQLHPIILSHLPAFHGDRISGWAALSVLADCMAALDPRLGGPIQWSKETLQQAAGWIEDQPRPLQCVFDCDRRLQQTLGIDPGPMREESKGSNRGDSRTRSSEALQQTLGGDDSWLPFLGSGAAHASQDNLPVQESIIRNWLLEEQDLQTYLGKARSLLLQCAAGAWSQNQIPFLEQGSFSQIIQATAWQESCFRQYDKQGEEIRFIRSYNRTSVGIMQVNEYVWRGIYDRELLRWNIRYNAAAGSEIVHLYLMRYALKRLREIQPLSEWSLEAIAGAMYAMYVGGPKAFDPYIRRWRTGDYRLSDRLFQQKLAWVLSGKWQKISKCLDGEQKRD